MALQNNETKLPKIYCFINSAQPEWYQVCAIAEDGHCLAQHTSSTPVWAQHDIGITSDWKHDNYKKHYPKGYELEWVNDVLKHTGLMAAYEKNQELAKAEGGTDNG